MTLKLRSKALQRLVQTGGLDDPGHRVRGSLFAAARGGTFFLRSKRRVFPVYRLDREAAGIVLVAHDKGSAGKRSRLFQNRSIVIHYQAQVLGNLAEKKPEDTILIPLDGKPAETGYTAAEYDPTSNTTEVDVIIRTGRKLQIRRHFEMIGFPVMRDPGYGEGNKNTSGLRLIATALEFQCPISGKFSVFCSPRSNFNQMKMG